MGLWNYCEVCGERIETGEPCIGVKEKSENLCGASICINCAKIENLPDGKELVSITDLIASAEAAEKRVEELEKSLSDAAQVLKTMQESTIPFYERRAEKAERERDTAVRHLSSLEVCGYCKNGQCTRRGGTKECKFEWVGSKED